MADIEVARLTARDGTKAAFDSVRRGITDLESSGSRLRGIFAGIGAGLSAGALVGFVRSSIDAADALNDLSERTNTSIEALSALQFAAKLSDLTNESLELGLKQLAKTVAEGSDAFRQLGIETQGVGLDKVMSDVAQALSRIEDPNKRTAAALEIFKKQAFELQPLLNSLAQRGLKPFADEAQRAGAIISTETARAAAQFNDDIDRLKTSVSGLGQSLASDLVGPLTQISKAMVEATQKGGLLLGVLRGFAETGKVALFGVDPTEIKKQTEFVKDLQKEITKLQDAIRYTDKAGIIGRLSIGDPADLRRQLATRELTLRQAQASLERMLNPPTEVAKKGGGLTFDAEADAKAKAADAARKKAIADAERDAEQLRKFNLANDVAAAEDRRAVAEAYNQVELEQQRKKAEETKRLTQQTQTDIERLLAGTQLGGERAAFKDIDTLNELLIAGKVNAEEYNAAFSKIQESLNSARGIDSGDKLSKMADDGKKAFADLQRAVEGWGRRTSDVFAEVVTGGKASWRDLIQSMIREAISLSAYKAVFGPLFAAIGAGIGGFFGGGAGAKGFFGGSALGNAFGPGGLIPFAAGGVVNSPTMFRFANGTGLMGEAGPEAILPLTRGPGGKLGVQASGGGGTTVYQISIDSRADRAAVRDEVIQGIGAAEARAADRKRRGGF